MVNIAILLADVTKPEMSNILTLTWPVTSLVTPRAIKFCFPSTVFPGLSNAAWIFRIGPVVSEVRGGGLEIAPPPSGARYKNTPVGRGLRVRQRRDHYAPNNSTGVSSPYDRIPTIASKQVCQLTKGVTFHCIQRLSQLGWLTSAAVTARWAFVCSWLHWSW